MTHLLSLNQVAMSYGLKLLFEEISFHVHEGDRIGIIGANGIGKSTLFKLMTGEEKPDEGSVSRGRDLTIGLVPQTPDYSTDKSIEAVVLDHLTLADSMNRLNETERQVQVATILDKLGFVDPSKRIEELSGGWVKRVALAAAMVTDPELLLLDEPTNHLDIGGIFWLERQINASRSACVVISHDRAFLETCCNKIVELNRRYPKGVLAVEGGYSRFLERRAEFLVASEKTYLSLQNKVRNEIEWLKRGPKARTSKDKGRIDQAHRMIDELSEMKTKARSEHTEIDFSASGRRTKRLLVAGGLSKSYRDRRLFEDLDLLLKPGHRIGLVGENGSGKSTLLKVLARQVMPDSGEIKQADNLQLVYFDQQRETLNPEMTLGKSLCEEGDCVNYQGRSVHVAGWARKFGFQAHQLETPLGRLSGGEQAKVQIARLMLRPADVLFLDEPTNDLDLPTLEMLEENLCEFPGAIVLVTHDRYMLDQLSTVMLGLDGKGGHVWVSNYAQWQEHLSKQTESESEPRKSTNRKRERNNRPRGLSYLEKREYEGLETAILEMEEEMNAAETRLSDPAIATDQAELEKAYEHFKSCKSRVTELYDRWEYLENKLIIANE